jgi:hypothetical protein
VLIQSLHSMGIFKVNIMAVIVILTTIIFFHNCNCKNNFGLNCENIKYRFQIFVKAIPGVDTMTIRDTVWISVNQSTTLSNIGSGESINYSGAENLGTAIAFQKITGTTPIITDAAESFNVKIISGEQTSTSSLVKSFLFTEKNTFYEFRLGIIPQEPGTYRLVLSNANNVYRRTDKCTKAAFNIDFHETNQHFYMFPRGGNTPPGGGTFYFHVR